MNSTFSYAVFRMYLSYPKELLLLQRFSITNILLSHANIHTYMKPDGKLKPGVSYNGEANLSLPHTDTNHSKWSINKKKNVNFKCSEFYLNSYFYVTSHFT